ncbi:NB-ARC domain-containing protein [Nocardia sp. CA-135398]|uniref:NB-ARC domain-containing protein n=1 Tax=Nocardia sp. CA-135398 TaxID=3239977 RepID=UPI003D99A7B4
MYEDGAGTMGVVPAPTHRLVGRDRELDDIVRLLLSRSFRLITLVGRGGIGKTALLTAAISRFRMVDKSTRLFWAGLAELAPGSDVGEVVEETARQVVKADHSVRPDWAALVDTLSQPGTSPQHTVLVLDNCEPVLEGGVRPFINDLLDAVPGLTIVATSREPVGWIDEQLIGVRQLASDDAVALFKQRAAATGHPISSQDEPVVAEICRHIENLPLNIELMAGRLRQQVPRMILDGLTGDDDDARLDWRYGPRVGAAPRHRAVKDAIDSSYDLCSDPEKLLFERMAVFASAFDMNPYDNTNAMVGGAEFDAIKAICGDDPIGDAGAALARHDVEALLERLVDRSMVTVHRTATTVRYSLPESLRVFARRRLAESGDGERTRLDVRHLHYYQNKVVYAGNHWFSDQEQELLDWARAAWDNIIAALKTSIKVPGQAGAGLQIIIGLIKLRAPFMLGSIRDARRWIERCLDKSKTMTPEPTELQVEALAYSAWLALRQGEAADARQLLDESVELRIPDSETRADWREHPEKDFDLSAAAEMASGTAEFMANNNPRAIEILERARDKFLALGDHGSAMMAAMFAGLAAGLIGTPKQADTIARLCYESATAAGARSAISWAEFSWALALNKNDKPEEALTVLRRSLTYQMSIGDLWGAMWSVELIAWTLAKLITKAHSTDSRNHDGKRLTTARASEIAILAGGLETLRSGPGVGTQIGEMGAFATQSRKATDVARRVLGPAVFDAAKKRGTRLRPEHNEVQRYALGTLRLSDASWDSLSEAERDVAIRIAKGQTRGEIASARGVSPKTYDTQVADIRTKLGIEKGADIAKHVPADVLHQDLADNS